MKRLHVLGLLLATALAGPSAFAHEDYNDDGDRYSARRCDTYYRDGHHGSSSTPRGARHSEDDTSEFDNGDPTGTGAVYVHNETGHYVVRGDGFYVEVIGGSYTRDGLAGGFVQGEVDPVEGGPDADFHVGSYAGATEPIHSENACVSAADNKVGESGVQDTGINGTYCQLDPAKTACTFTAFESGIRFYSEFATGFHVLIKRGSTTITNLTVTSPVANDSQSFPVKAGDKVTCELIGGSSPVPVGRLSCSG